MKQNPPVVTGLTPNVNSTCIASGDINLDTKVNIGPDCWTGLLSIANPKQVITSDLSCGIQKGFTVELTILSTEQQYTIYANGTIIDDGASYPMGNKSLGVFPVKPQTTPASGEGEDKSV